MEATPIRPISASYADFIDLISLSRPMLESPVELLAHLGGSIRARRIAQGLSQEEAAKRAGLGLRTWRRLERDGHATTETLVNAAFVMRCEQTFKSLFPLPPASSLDDLLKRQSEPDIKRRRAPRKTAP